MKFSRLLWLALPLVLMVTVACNRDDDEEEVRNYAPALPSGLEGLHHDTYNVDAPVLEPGIYMQGARFSPADQQNLQGGKLAGVQFFVASEPLSSEIRVYRGGTQSPNELVYSSSITQLNRNNWNFFSIPDTINIAIEDNPLWVTIRFQVATEGRYIGCDPGPAHGQGDWMWSEDDPAWSRFLNRTGASINWNVRAAVQP